MAQAADSRKCEDFSCTRWFDGSRDRSIAAERHVGSVLVVAGHVLADQSEQMPLAKHDYVIQKLAAQRAHPSFGVPVLPRRTRRDGGASRGRIEDALAVAFAFNTMNRLADTFGFPVPGPKGFEAGAKYLLTHGYR